MEPMNIKRIIKEYHALFYAHKFDNLDKIDQFLERQFGKIQTSKNRQ